MTLLGSGQLPPEGFKYQPEMVSRDDEGLLLSNLAQLPFKELELHDFLRSSITFRGLR